MEANYFIIIVVIFAMHSRESAMGVYVPQSWTPLHIPPKPIPQVCPKAPALSFLSHASDLDLWTVSHMVIYMFQLYPL